MKVMAALALGWVGCDCASGFPELFYDDLGAVCDGAPCGWELGAGAAESVRTIHSSERGVRLGPGTTIAHDVDFVVDAATSFGNDDAPRLHALIGCEGDETRVRVRLETASEAPLEVVVDGTTGDDDPLPLRAIDFTGPGGAPAIEDRALRMIITIEGPGACTIDELRVVGRTVRSEC